MCFNVLTKTIVSMILKRRDAFTIDDIVFDVINTGISCGYKDVEDIVLGYRETGVVYRQGKNYKLSEELFGLV